ncbi:MAG: hypothetical protein KF886_16910 [Candidatus Hydrogenedentes bacterium]|nr:hypothetical protein [Candidatus Hydrogenedentota bacterium]
MQFTPLEQDIHTLYVPEDFVHRVACHAARGDLFPGLAAAPARIVRCRRDHCRVQVRDRRASRLLHFNELDVWRMDNRTIQYRVCYRPRRGEGVREWWRSAPPLLIWAFMLPVIGILFFLLPELALVPVISLAAGARDRRRELDPLARQLKAIADGAD